MQNLLLNNEHFLEFTEEGETFFITFNSQADNSGYTLLNSDHQRLDRQDYGFEFRKGIELLKIQMENS